MTRIVHISDLHFGRTDPQVVEGLVADINRQPPDLVVVSGDLTLSARRVEFQEARSFLDRLAAPFLAVPGNHDISPYRMVERFVFPYRRWRTFISPTVEPEWRDTQVAIVGINTARRLALHWNWSHGRVNRAQIERVGRRFARLPRHLFRVVVAHHPFMPPAEAAGTRLVGRARKAVAAFSQYGVDLILSGHLHRGYRRALAEETEVLPGGLGPTAGGLHVVHAATATSTRLRDEPNSYNIISVADRVFQMSVRQWDGALWVDRDAG